jgi:myo-inositol 2-dehydrogenase/D-chiro-inositol 1-dehydrogenase
VSEPTPASRRDFLKTSAAVAGATLASGLAVPFVHAAGGDVLRVGLVGCGGRGTGAALQALNADRNVRLVALGDAFADRIEDCHNQLKQNAHIADRVTVSPDHRFVGFDAYRSVIDHVDVVLLATPPGFRPIHLEAAVAAGKHIFCEKPMAVDAPGVRRVMAAAKEAQQRKVSLVSGFCWRRHPVMRETMSRIHEGALGNIVALQCSYNAGGLWHRDREQGWSDMEYQLRNWLYYTWLSGDHNVEQHVHSLDKAAWAMKNENPIKAVGLGGRQVRTGPEFGHIFDHHAVVYEYADGTRLFSFCRQQPRTASDVSDHYWGTKGSCDVKASFPPQVDIKGASPWGYHTKGDSLDRDMYQIEHDELFASIRSGQPINDGEWMANSTLMAIMGRMATYTGQVITWQQALHSKEDLSPKAYDMKASLPEPKVAMPGMTKFV